MGTSLTNITAEILKFKVKPDQGTRQEFLTELPRAVAHEELAKNELEALTLKPNVLPSLNDANFEAYVKGRNLVMIAFGAPWCPWSQRLQPVSRL